MKKATNFLIAVLFIGSLPLSVYADGPISVDVPSDCTVTDTNGVNHAFPKNDSPSNYLGICMLQAAKESGRVNFTVTNDPNFGLYVESVNNIAPGATEYWAIWYNGVLAECGIGCIPLSSGDTLSLKLTDWTTNAESSIVAFQVQSLSPSPIPPSGVGGGSEDIEVAHYKLYAPSALAYLASVQHSDGSFGSPFLSDWVAIAIASADESPAKIYLRNYLSSTSPLLANITDYERHAMTLMALGINPYSGTPVDYITPIVQAFDETQIGDIHLDNDDIFALFPLLHSGYTADDIIIQKTVAFILSAQNEDGSWDNSVDMTAAAIQALAQVSSLPNVSAAVIKAGGYLRTQQNFNGGFGNSFSTSWVLQAISALGESADEWMPYAFTPNDYLAGLQQSDGGVELINSTGQTRQWATAYAIPASLGKTWGSLLQSFQKPIAQAVINATTTPTPHTRTASQKTEAPIIKTSAIFQTAAAVNAPSSGFIMRLWGYVASIFAMFL